MRKLFEKYDCQLVSLFIILAGLGGLVFTVCVTEYSVFKWILGVFYLCVSGLGVFMFKSSPK